MKLSPLDGSLGISLHEAGDIHAVIPVRHEALEHGRGIPSRFAFGNQAARATRWSLMSDIPKLDQDISDTSYQDPR